MRGIKGPQAKFCTKAHQACAASRRVHAKKRAVKATVLIACARTGCEKTFSKTQGGRVYCTKACWQLVERAAVIEDKRVRALGLVCKFCEKPLGDQRRTFCDDSCKEGLRKADVDRRRPHKTCQFPGCSTVLTGRNTSFCSDEHRARNTKLKPKPAKTPKISKDQREKEARELKCFFCGEPVPYERAIHAVGRGWKAFCKDGHRAAYWNRENLNKKRIIRFGSLEIKPQKCLLTFCEKMFTPDKRARACRLYCSAKCAQTDRFITNAPQECEMCDEPISEEYRRAHTMATTCSRECQNERMLISRELKKVRESPRPIRREDEI